MDSAYLEDAKNRVLSMLTECILGADAVADPLHTQEQYPYFVISVDEYEPTEDSEDLSIRPYVFTIQYILGTTNSGYKGALATQLYTDEPTILNFFMARRRLQCAAYPSRPDYLQMGTDTAITRTAGMGSYTRSGVGISVYGTVFQLRVTMCINIDQVFV